MLDGLRVPADPECEAAAERWCGGRGWPKSDRDLLAQISLDSRRVAQVAEFGDQSIATIVKPSAVEVEGGESGGFETLHQLAGRGGFELPLPPESSAGFWGSVAKANGRRVEVGSKVFIVRHSMRRHDLREAENRQLEHHSVFSDHPLELDAEAGVGRNAGPDLVADSGL